ncbi:hypothetical protein HDV63DRAFT_363216 [Trichoderma sp. SZMC 28014]
MLEPPHQKLSFPSQSITLTNLNTRSISLAEQNNITQISESSAATDYFIFNPKGQLSHWTKLCSKKEREAPRIRVLYDRPAGQRLRNSSAAYRIPSQPTSSSLDCLHVGKQCKG